MTDLYPTKTRRDLLAAVDRGQVRRQNGIATRNNAGRPKTRVDAAIREAEAAGWVELGADDVYALTDVGREVLAGGGHG